jgi:K+-sensing histidine kinase KdpD
VPLIFGGQAIGTLSVYTGQPYSFSNEEVRILSALAELSAIAIEKARLYERVVDVEEQLRQNEKLSALGLLAAEVAHEIRNPLICNFPPATHAPRTPGSSTKRSSTSTASSSKSSISPAPPSRSSPR